MQEYSLSCQIRECAEPDGGLLLELLVEGQEPRCARARVSGEQLDLLRKWFGLQRSDVITHLHLALLKSLRTRDYNIAITNITQVPPFKLRYVGWFTYQASREISTGVVWYDLIENMSWPDSEEYEMIGGEMKSLVLDILAEEDRAARSGSK
jgi:hypothetical protein